MKLSDMNFKKLTILSLVFLMSGVVGFLLPDVTLANKNFSYSRQKLMRESRDNAKRLQRIKMIRQKQYGSKSEPTKIRIRGLSGTAKSKTLTLSNTSIQFLWGSLGIGHTMMKFEKSKSGKEFSILNSFNDISYTFGDEMSFTIGTGVLGSGQGIYTESQKEFTSEKASGSANFFSIGIEYNGIEFLYGQRRFDFENKEFQRTVSESTEIVEKNVKVNGTIHLLGIGVSF